MASVISTSSSGLDIPTVVSTLVSRQKDPEQARINKAGTAATTQLSAISQIKSSMTTLKSALDKVVSSADTNAYKASVPTDAGFTATTTSSAAPGNYSVEVVSLASAQKLASGAFTADATVGSGTLTIGYGDKSITVDISGTDKLTDIAAAINKAAGGKGVTASVVTANDGQHLVFNAVDTGTKGALTVSASDPSLSALTFGAGVTGGLTQQVAAADALVRVDGFERTSSSNTVTDIVPGVVLNLTKAAEGTKVTLGVTADTSGLKGNLTAFAAAYNTANTLLKNSSSYNAETRTASALTGDSLVRGLQQQLRGGTQLAVQARQLGGARREVAAQALGDLGLLHGRLGEIRLRQRHHRWCRGDRCLRSLHERYGGRLGFFLDDLAEQGDLRCIQRIGQQRRFLVRRREYAADRLEFVEQVGGLARRLMAVHGWLQRRGRRWSCGG